MRFHLDAGAYQDAIESADWYDARDPGVGQEFLETLDGVIESIQNNSEIGSWVETAPSELNIRRVLMKRFPYSVIYELLPNEVHVLAVAHERQRPNYWLKRRRHG